MRDCFFDVFLDCQIFLDCQKTSPKELRSEFGSPRLLIFRPGERLPLIWRVNPSEPTQDGTRFAKSPRDASRRHETPRDDVTRRYETQRDATRRLETPPRRLRDASETPQEVMLALIFMIFSNFRLILGPPGHHFSMLFLDTSFALFFPQNFH